MRILLVVGLVGVLGCGGASEVSETDAGQDAPSGMSGCYPDASLACGPVVGRWCWASPSTFQPAAACAPYHPEGGGTATGYWCCP